MFSSCAEGVLATEQYLEFAQLTEESVVFDLGAYSGLTSIQFDMEIAKDNPKAIGKVIAIDADYQNIPIIYYNLRQYKEQFGRNIEFLYRACSDTDTKLAFSSEGNMGASLVDCVGRKRGVARIEYVQGITLSSLAKYYGVPKVDFIKCDIEGGELFVFNDRNFFEEYSPRIIVEAHYIKGELTSTHVISTLSQYGYVCREVRQQGYDLPLLECVRT